MVLCEANDFPRELQVTFTADECECQ